MTATVAEPLLWWHSAACQNTSERERRRIRAGLPPTIEPLGTPRICVCCGGTYRPVRTIQRFCSPDCRSFHATHCLVGR